MTWHADEILTLGNPAVLRAVADDPLLAPFAYHLTEPLDHEWHVPDVVHGLPDTGLVVVRPVCAATADGDTPDSFLGEPVEYDWYEEPVLDWLRFSGETDSELLALRARVAEARLDPENVPPAAFLSHLRQLARKTEAPFLFYSCSMWGGDVETEYAFVLDRVRPLALVTLPPETPLGRPLLMILEASTPARIEPGDTLMLALRHLSLDLPTSFFAPHTRSFPWSKYRLESELPRPSRPRSA